jgi:Bacterial Ig-like domain (group 2)/Galactose oxidase, central domain
MKKRVLSMLLTIAAAFGVWGCGGGSTSSPSSTPTPTPSPSVSVTVTPNPAAVLPGGTQSFAATVTGTTNTAVTWSVQENSGGTINSTGLYTAPLSSTGTFHVVATSQANSAARGIAAVTVQLSQVTISPAAVILPPDGTQTFTAAVAGFANTGVTWTIQETGGGFINGAGFYTAPSAQGFYHVIATSVENTTVSASATVSVTTYPVSFLPTGSLQKARGFHTATLLNNGEVLMAGGANPASDPQCIGGIVSAELYDAYGAASTLTGSLTAPRYDHTATLLPNGTVLVVGGFGVTSDCPVMDVQAQNTAELYDPAAGSFNLTGNMASPRGWHTATLLKDGKVLVTGGADQDPAGTGSASAELYDPSTGAFTQTGSMSVARFRHTATLLNDGSVLIVGGVSADSSIPTSTAELYNPATGSFTLTGSMSTAREEHTATLLGNGTVLIAGGESPVTGSSGLQDTATAEVYDPSTGLFAPTGSMTEARNSHTATPLMDGTVLVAGGGNNSSTAELFDPSTGSFTKTGSMEFGRSGHTATAQTQPSGIYSVLVVGGGSFNPLATAEMYTYGDVWDD